MFFQKDILNQYITYKAMILSNQEPNIHIKRFYTVIGCI